MAQQPNTEQQMTPPAQPIMDPGLAPASQVATQSQSGSGIILKVVIILALLCLCVTVVIGGALFFFAGQGIDLAQTNARDTARRSMGQDINAGMADYLIQYGEFPNKITIEGEDIILSGADGQVVVPGSYKIAQEDLELDGYTSSAGSTTDISTEFCFAPDLADGYAIAIKLSNGEWYNFGTSSFDCEDVDPSETITTQEELEEELLGDIETLQVNVRNTTRKDSTQDMNAAIADFFSMNGVFPDAIAFEDDTFTLTGPTGSPLTRDLLDSYVAPGVDGTLTEGTEVLGSTSTSTTAWCFITAPDGYALGVELEDGTWFDNGTSQTEYCSR